MFSADWDAYTSSKIRCWSFPKRLTSASNSKVDPSSRTNGYISFCRRGRAHDSTVESRFRDIQTRTRMHQAPSHTSRVRTITVGPFDTYPNVSNAHCYPKSFTGFMHRARAAARSRRGGRHERSGRLGCSWRGQERCLAAVAAVAVVEKAAVMAGSAAARTRHTHLARHGARCWRRRGDGGDRGGCTAHGGGGAGGGGGDCESGGGSGGDSGGGVGGVGGVGCAASCGASEGPG